jgi:hypothetical protein
LGESAAEPEEISVGSPADTSRGLPAWSDNFYTASPIDNKPYQGTLDQPPESDWKCVESNIVTPAQTIAGAAEKAVTAQFDFILTSEDLSQ